MDSGADHVPRATDRNRMRLLRAHRKYDRTPLLRVRAEKACSNSTHGRSGQGETGQAMIIDVPLLCLDVAAGEPGRTYTWSIAVYSEGPCLFHAQRPICQDLLWPHSSGCHERLAIVRERHKMTSWWIVGALHLGELVINLLA